MAGRALSAFWRSVFGAEHDPDDAELGEFFMGDLAVMFNTWFQEWGKRTPLPRKGRKS